MEEKNEQIVEKKGNDTMKDLLSLLGYLVVALIVTYLLLHFVGQRTLVNGESMENTLQDQDNLIVDKLTYRFNDPERFDIIVFPFQHGESTYYIKRIIGLPGETVQIIDSEIYVDGEVLEENYGKEEIEPGTYGLAQDPVELGDDEYFVMGDNRNNSQDSRDPVVGKVHREDIIGRAWLRMWPISSAGFIKK